MVTIVIVLLVLPPFAMVIVVITMATAVVIVILVPHTAEDHEEGEEDHAQHYGNDGQLQGNRLLTLGQGVMLNLVVSIRQQGHDSGHESNDVTEEEGYDGCHQVTPRVPLRLHDHRRLVELDHMVWTIVRWRRGLLAILREALFFLWVHIHGYSVTV